MPFVVVDTPGAIARYRVDAATKKLVSLEDDEGMGGDTALLANGTVPLTADWDSGNFEIRARTLEADVATGTAPLTIASTTVVTNLNADKVDGLDAADLMAGGPGSTFAEDKEQANNTAHAKGAVATFSTGDISHSAMVKLDATRFVVLYRDEADGFGKARVGSISGTTISYGTEVTFNAFTTTQIAAGLLDTDKIILVYKGRQEDTTVSEVMVATISGTTITFDTANQAALDAAVATNNTTRGRNTLAVLSTSKAVIINVATGAAEKSYGYVVTVAATTPTVGSRQVVEGGVDITRPYLVGLDSSNMLMVYSLNTTFEIKLKHVSESGGTLTFGASTQIGTATGDDPQLVKLSSTAVAALYDNDAASGRPNVSLIKIAGTALTIGTGIEVEPGGASVSFPRFMSITALSANAVAVCMAHDATLPVNMFVGAHDGQTFDFSPELGIQAVSENGEEVAVMAIDADNLVVTWADKDSSDDGKSVYVTLTTTGQTAPLRLDNLYDVEASSPQEGSLIAASAGQWNLSNPAFLSMNIDEDAAASAAAYNVFDQDNYGGALSKTDHVTAQNVTFTPADGKFTLNTGARALQVSLGLPMIKAVAADLVRVIVKKNGSAVFSEDYQVLTTKTHIFVSCILGPLVSTDYLEVEVDSQDANTVQVLTGAHIALAKLN